MSFATRLSAMALAIVTVTAQALPDDSNQPIQIEANQAERDAKTGITTYTGNVDIRQGSIHIAADNVVLESRNNELSSIHATGNPASYTQQLTGPADMVEAHASTIHFDVAKDLITLQGNGNIKQQGSSISGDRIEYDIKSERVKAQAAEPGSKDNNKRISVVIPGNKHAAGKEAPAEKKLP